MNVCRACGVDSLNVFLSLGRTPLANSLLRPEDLARPEPTYPLDVAFCTTCALVQILETVPPETLFGDYLYFSSFSTTMLEHVRVLAERLTLERRLGETSLVVELASNDGYLLQWYKRAGVPVLGIEPARNVAAMAIDRGIPTRSIFFGRDAAAALATEGVAADVVHAHNVLAHVADLNGFVAGIATILKPSGVAVIEVPYVKDLIDHVEFDTIYHEHLCYFSLTALDRLFRSNGLAVVNVERVAIHGGSLRVFVGRSGQHAEHRKPNVEGRPAVASLMAQETTWGLTDIAAYRAFSARVGHVCESLRALLGDLKRSGKRIAAYGAAAKGSTLLNTARIGRDTIDYVVDRSPHKQGRLMPGVHIPIHAVERVASNPPDFVLVLAWNLANEIIAQHSEFARRGGKFIIPIPEPRIVET